MKTIKQIADELGVSKQAVSYRLKQLEATKEHGVLAVKENGVLVVSLAGETLIKSAFSENNRQTFGDKEPPKENASFGGDTKDDLIIILGKQVAELNAELAKEREHSRKQADQITELADKLAVLTDNAQKLHLGTMHSNKQLTGMALEYTEEQPTAAEDTDKPRFMDRLRQLFK